jgi:hypothetical protein
MRVTFAYGFRREKRSDEETRSRLPRRHRRRDAEGLARQSEPVLNGFGMLGIVE